MSRRPKKSAPSSPGVEATAPAPVEASFDEVVGMIRQSRARALQAANTALIDLYWQLGEYISRKIETAAWGEGVVDELAGYIATRHADLRGFTRSNLFRMRQLYETYRDEQIVAPLVRQLSWAHNLLILGRCKRPEEREFYLRLSLQERWTKRDLERQLASGLFLRAVLSPVKLSAALTQSHEGAEQAFKDRYLLEFLDLPEQHSEADVRRGIVAHLRQFLLELGRGFCFVGEEYRIQVGTRDFFIDLLFYHRDLQALVAFDIKVDEFQPEYLGKLDFYLEALDRDVRKSHERPSIGVLLCASKNEKVVEYSLSRTLSPALVAAYQTALPDKALLEAKLREYYELARPAGDEGDEPTRYPPPPAGRPPRRVREVAWA